MPKRPKTSEEIESRRALMRASGNRLRLVRDVLGMDQGEFAKRAGLTSNQYNMIELGDRLPSIEAAIELCDTYRISLDWIFRGEPGDMSVKLYDGIRALMDARER